MDKEKGINLDIETIKQKVKNFLLVLKNEEKILNFKLFQKPVNQTNILNSIQFCILKIIIKSKNFWLNLIQKSIAYNTKKQYLYIFCIGLFNCVATVPFGIIIILPITFGSLFYILEHQQKSTIKHQILTITSFLFGHFVSIFWWFFVPLTTDFKHLFWITPFAICGLPLLISILFAPFFILFCKMWNLLFEQNKILARLLSKIDIDYNNVKDFKWFVVFLLSWLCGDFIRAHIIFGGFPWMMFGHFVNYSFAFQSVKFLGIDLYSIFFLALVLIPYFVIFKKHNILIKKVSYAIFTLWIINCIIGLLIIIFAKSSHIHANIVAPQANIPATLDNDINASDILYKNFNLIKWSSYTNNDTIMLLPESAINMSISSGDHNTINIANILPNNRSILVAGGLWTNKTKDKIYNVAYAINSDGYIVDMYKKQNLVPFGEYLPIRNILPDTLINITGMYADFSKDGENNLFILYQDLPIIYPTICYESIFPKYVKKNIKQSRKQLKTLFKEDGNILKNLKERGEIIVNLTNDAWIKWSVAPYQHFLMTRFLAVYTGLPVVRVSNNGISAYIEKTGVVRTKTKLNKEDILYVKNV